MEYLKGETLAKRLEKGPLPLAQVLQFDVHPDGRRFAVLKAPATGETSPANKVSFIFNFFDELRRKVPPGKD